MKKLRRLRAAYRPPGSCHWQTPPAGGTKSPSLVLNGNWGEGALGSYPPRCYGMLGNKLVARHERGYLELPFLFL